MGAAAPNGVDANDAVLLEFDGGKGALGMLSFGMFASSPTAAAICGTKGRIEIARTFYRLTDFTVYYNDGAVFRYETPRKEKPELGREGGYDVHFLCQICRQ